MGKSYRKFPVVRQERVDKEIYNRRFRRLKDGVPYKGGQYKKKYVIDDWHYCWTKEDAILQYERDIEWLQDRYPTLDDWLQHWEKSVKRK